jgi:hypothetical protein
MVSFSSIWLNAAGMGKAGLRSFLRTMVLLSCAGVILGIVTYYWLMGGAPFAANQRAVVAAVLAVLVLGDCILAGIALAAKRAVAMALVHLLRSQRPGQAMASLLFQRLLGVTGGQPLGQRGGMVAQAVERVPLAQLEKRMSEAIGDLLGGEAAGGGIKGWMRRRLERRLLGMVQKYTLARFREADAQYGSVDLAAVQIEVESSIDDRLVRKLRRGIDLWTAVAVVLLAVQVPFLRMLSAFVR